MDRANTAEEPDEKKDPVESPEPAVAKLPQAGFSFEDYSADLADEAELELITRRQLVLLSELCEELEACGISEQRWRDGMQHLSGCRSRKALTGVDAARVISCFAHTLNALLANKTEK